LSMDPDSWPIVLLLFLTIVLSGLTSAIEMSYNAVNRVRIKNSADDGDKSARRTLIILSRFEEALTTILILYNILSIAAASLATLLVTRLWGSGEVAWSTVVLALIFYVFVDMLPKTIARRRADIFSLKASSALLLLMRVLKPFTFLFTKWGELISRHFPSPDDPSFTEDELHDIIETIEDEGLLEPDQQELLQSAFEFGAIAASDILIPMDKVVMIDSQATQDQIVSKIDDYKFSRFPVWDARRDRVVGILQVNRFLTARLTGTYTRLRAILIPIRSYRSDMHIDDLMTLMNQHRSHMALIADETGKSLGIVTMEDILEELVGEIYDESDPAAEPAAVL
jgi:CBS domain containing-hemolysin-like protein